MKKPAKAKMARHSFAWGIRSGAAAVLPFIGAMLFFLVYPVWGTIFTYDQVMRQSTALAPGEQLPTLVDTYRYILYYGQNYSNEMPLYLLEALMVLCPILLGCALFRFLADKRTVNVYYSLGLSRRTLFFTRYGAGVLLLAMVILFSVGMNLTLNLAVFGSSWQLWSAALYQIFGFLIVSVFSLTVTAAVFSMVGTVGEGVCFSVSLLSAPTLVLGGLDFYLSRLWGSPYGQTFLTTASWGSGTRSSLLLKWSGCNPMILLHESLRNSAALRLDGMNDVVAVQSLKWAAPHFAPLLFWLLLTAAVLALGFFLAKRRKAEICGFLDSSPVLSAGVTLLWSFFALGCVIKGAAYLLWPKWFSFLLGALAYLIVVILATLVLTRSLPLFRKKWKWILLQGGVCALLCVACATGFFGFSSRVPDIKKVKSAAVTLPAQSIRFSGYSRGIGSNSYYFSEQGDLLFDFTTERDLNQIQELHRLLIADGDQPLKGAEGAASRSDQVVPARIQFIYTLKDGSQVKRYYDHLPVRTLERFTALEDTDRYRQLVDELFVVKPPKNEAYEGGDWLKSLFQNKHEIRLNSRYLTRETQLPLTDEQDAELMRRLRKDLAAQTSRQRFFPESPALGAIYLMLSSEDDGSGYEEPSRTAKQDSMECRILLRPEMKNTLAFLQKNGFTPLLQEEGKVKSITVIPAEEFGEEAIHPGRSALFGQYAFYLQQFVGGWVKAVDQEKGSNTVGNGPQLDAFHGGYTSRNQALITEVMEHAYLSYFFSVDGFFVLAEHEEKDTYTVCFLPASEAPQSLRDALND